MSSNERLKRVLLVEAIVILVLLVAAELTLRRFAPQYGHQLFDAEHTGGYPIELNADGLRGPLVPKAREPGEYRVLVLGDSTTFGVAVPVDSIWPTQLTSLRPDGGKLSVVNASFPGTGLRHLRLGLETAWSEYKPDAILVALSSNHVALALIERNDPPSVPANQRPVTNEAFVQRSIAVARRTYKSLLLPTFLSHNVETLLYRGGLLDHRITASAPFGAMLAHGYRQLDIPPTLVDQAWAELEKELLGIKATADGLRATLLVTMVPTRFSLSDRASDNEKVVPRERLRVVPAEKTRTICDRHGIAYVDVLGALRDARTAAAARGEEPALYVHGDYTHLDADGHAVVARAVARRLFAEAGRTGPGAR
jgi:lysophospholipase L1-like esterase